MGAKQKKGDDKRAIQTRSKRVGNSSDLSASNKKKRSDIEESNENENKVELNSETKSKTSSNTISSFSSWKNSIVHFRDSVAIGSKNVLCNTEPVKNAIMSHLKGLKVSQFVNCFQRRVTSIACHPIYSNVVVAGSKGGELILFDLNSLLRVAFRDGIGPGGSIVGLKFSLDVPTVVYTASITGNIKEENLIDESLSKTFLSTATVENWFASLDVCYSRKLIMTGDCTGNAYLITTSGESVWPKSKKLHSNKISHVEFHPRDPNVFVTASRDHSVKLWDLRYMSDPGPKKMHQPTHNFLHLKGVNSAYFSPSNGCSLLTTDQHSELRVYSCPNWEKLKVIPHPHRQFQHLTPIKATWFPLEDIVVVGRYPDKNFLSGDSRTIDFLDSTTGNILYRKGIKMNKIYPINVFNNSGDGMISAAGTAMLIWREENYCSYSSNKQQGFFSAKIKS